MQTNNLYWIKKYKKGGKIVPKNTLEDGFWSISQSLFFKITKYKNLFISYLWFFIGVLNSYFGGFIRISHQNFRRSSIFTSFRKCCKIVLSIVLPKSDLKKRENLKDFYKIL